MGRKRKYKNDAEKAKAFRERHKPIEYITISKKEYSEKLSHIQELIKRLGYDYEKVVNVAYPKYKKWWQEHGVNVGLYYDIDYEDGEKFSTVLGELEGKVAKESEFLGCDITVHEMFWYILNYIGRSEMLKCNHCEILFSIWEQSCPRCSAILKITEDE